MKAKGYSTIAGLEKLSPEEIKQRNLETYGSKIKNFRNRAGMTAEQLADALQISKSSVRNWECGLTRPDPEFLYRMFTILDVEPNEFFGFKGIGTLLTTEERDLVDYYRSLDKSGKEDLLTFAEAMNKKSHKRKLMTAYDRMNGVEDWGRYAAAGDGTDWPELMAPTGRSIRKRKKSSCLTVLWSPALTRSSPLPVRVWSRSSMMETVCLWSTALIFEMVTLVSSMFPAWAGSSSRRPTTVCTLSIRTTMISFPTRMVHR